MDKKNSLRKEAVERTVLRQCRFAQASFQLVVLVNHVLLGGALIGDRLDAHGAVLVSGVFVIGLKFSVTSSLQAPIHHW